MARFKAHLVADGLHFGLDLKRALDALESFLALHPDGTTFRAVADVAARRPETEPFLNGIELRRAWTESPMLWGFRSSAAGSALFGEPGRGAMSVRRAVAIAGLRRDWPVEEMLDDAWLEEWVAMPPARPTLGERIPPGFWSFADYAEHRAAWGRSDGRTGPCGDAQTSDGETFAAFRSDLVWADRGLTVSGRSLPESWRGAAPRHAVRGASRAGGRVPPAVAERYAAWRDKTFGDGATS